jgi:hypothetical protein
MPNIHFKSQTLEFNRLDYFQRKRPIKKDMAINERSHGRRFLCYFLCRRAKKVE